MNKRGLSPIIATVMLLLITVAAVGILAGVVIPWVRGNLGSSQECFEVLNKLTVYETQYNCFYDDATVDGRAGISVKIDDPKIKGFKMDVFGAGSSTPYEIKNGITNANLRMLGGTFVAPNNVIQVPENGGVRTYIIDTDGVVVERIDLYPILTSGKVCEKSDDVVLNECVNPTTQQTTP